MQSIQLEWQTCRASSWNGRHAEYIPDIALSPTDLETKKKQVSWEDRGSYLEVCQWPPRRDAGHLLKTGAGIWDKIQAIYADCDLSGTVECRRSRTSWRDSTEKSSQLHPWGSKSGNQPLREGESRLLCVLFVTSLSAVSVTTEFLLPSISTFFFKLVQYFFLNKFLFPTYCLNLLGLLCTHNHVCNSDISLSLFGLFSCFLWSSTFWALFTPSSLSYQNILPKLLTWSCHYMAQNFSVASQDIILSKLLIDHLLPS